MTYAKPQQWKKKNCERLIPTSIIKILHRKKGCQDSSMTRLLRVDPMVSGSSPTSAKLSLRVRRVASSLKFQA